MSTCAELQSQLSEAQAALAIQVQHLEAAQGTANAANAALNSAQMEMMNAQMVVMGLQNELINQGCV